MPPCHEVLFNNKLDVIYFLRCPTVLKCILKDSVIFVNFVILCNTLQNISYYCGGEGRDIRECKEPTVRLGLNPCKFLNKNICRLYWYTAAQDPGYCPQVPQFPGPAQRELEQLQAIISRIHVSILVKATCNKT